MFWRKQVTKTERVYLDWAAATPLLPAAKAAMEPWLSSEWGNPSAIHTEGQQARHAVEEARETVARTLEVRPEYITWTGSGTEASNLAILGTIERWRQAGRTYESLEIISTALEHPATTRTLAHLADRGVTVHEVPVSDSGRIDLDALRSLVSDNTILLTTHYVNSEIGTIQPTRTLRKILQEQASQAVLHIDAAQAPLWLSCQFASVGADLLTLDAGKCCGPKGVGLLALGRGVDLVATTYGGGQEGGLRPGTENVASIVGAAVAFAWAQSDWRGRSETVRAARDEALTHILETIPGTVLNGAFPRSGLGNAAERVANNINISIPGLDTEYATIVLDKHGYAVSTKSACSGAGGGASAVVMASTGDPARATATLRITLGPETTQQQLQDLTTVLGGHVERMKQLTA